VIKILAGRARTSADIQKCSFNTSCQKFLKPNPLSGRHRMLTKRRISEQWFAILIDETNAAFMGF
jgi:hypothetical protein